MRLVCYNIEYCEGMQGLWYQYLQFWRVLFPPKNLDRQIIDALKELDLDILALVEVDLGSFRAKKDEVRYFAEGLRMKNFVEKIKYPLTGWLRLFHHVPILNKQANAILAKQCLRNVTYHVLHEGTKRVVIEATIHCPKPVTLLLAHLALGRRTRAKQIRELIKIVNGIPRPVILMGDFNTFSGAHEIAHLLRDTHLKDRYGLDTHSIRMTAPTWHPSKRLDYVLASPEIRVNDYKVLNFPFSDHMPLYVDFTVR